MRFLVDTGATLVTLPAERGAPSGHRLPQGPAGARCRHANGVAARAYRVRLDTVRVGDIELNNVDAVVSENDAMGMSLLGMSFLNRMEMQREGESMTLTKRY